MPNVSDLKRGRFLTQKDIERPVVVTIASFKEVNVAMEGAEPDERWVLSFREFDKPMVLNSTNGQIIAAITGSEEFKDWVGQRIVLYVDPNVSFGGKLVGGIRCRALRTQTVAQPKPATFDRAKSIENLRAAQKAAGLPVDSRARSLVSGDDVEAERLGQEADALAEEIAESQSQREPGEDEV